MLIDLNHPDGNGQIRVDYIRHSAGRRFIESPKSEGIIRFRFYPEQECFVGHRVNLERSPFYLKNTIPLRGDDWIDDLSEGLYKRERMRQKG